ncbi:MAG: hypothetical protein Q9203_004909 [Teloschistes exilis]
MSHSSGSLGERLCMDDFPFQWICDVNISISIWLPLTILLACWVFPSTYLITSLQASDKFGTSAPIRISLGFEEVYLIAGVQNLKLVWKNSQWLTAKAGHIVGLYTILDTPKKSLPFYQADNSGIGKEPLPHSSVPPEHRVWHLTHQPIVNCLSGSNLTLFINKFQDCLSKRIDQYPCTTDWSELPDLFSFVYHEVIHVQLEVLCGTFFLEQNPEFVQDFARFNHSMTYLKMGLPSWMTPRSAAFRRVCLDSIKKWHEALKLHDPNRLVDTGEINNSRFGNDIMRSRRRIMAKMDVMDVDTAASADLGMLWALNANPATAAFWLLMEIVREPSLHPAVQHEIETASSRNDVAGSLSVSCLNDSALLQSMYAETLRLRVSVLIIQSAEFSDFNFNGWLLPKDKLILISSRIAHMDKSWMRNLSFEKPVDEFWAERFLTWKDKAPPKAAFHSPTKDDGMPSQQAESRTGNIESDRWKEAQFSMTGLGGMWIPYGGGPGICPGRNLAKSIMLLTSAMFFRAYEFQLLPRHDQRLECDIGYYGLGVLPPNGKIPFRVRRRGDHSKD